MLADEISKLAAHGRSYFGFDELQSRMGSTPGALKAALRRLLKKGELAMPLRGFYVIVPPEYHALGCRPAEQFIPEYTRAYALMEGEFAAGGNCKTPGRRRQKEKNATTSAL